MKVVFTNGCFDRFHDGHRRLLRRCLEEAGPGGAVVIAVNSDDSVRKLKGAGRPIYEWRTRAFLISEFLSGDTLWSVVPFDDSPYGLIEAIRPAVLVKGDDWQEDKIIGAFFVRSYGGTVVRVPRLPGVSTTESLSRADKSSHVAEEDC